MMLQIASRLFLLPALLALALAAPVHANTSDQEELLIDAERTLDVLLRSEDTGPYVRNYLPQAKAVMIFPSLLKGAFFFGAEGGAGVLLARGEGGGWSYPAFHLMGSGSFGLQIGGQASQLILLIMTDKALSAVLDGRVKLGADIRAAMGPRGVGAAAATTINLGADIYSYALAKGAYLGVSIDGAVIYPRETWNQAFYNDEAAAPRGIVVEGHYANPSADPLRGKLATVN